MQNSIFCLVPDSENPVNQKSTKEAKNNIGPGVPGVELHEPCRVQIQVLKKPKKTHSIQLVKQTVQHANYHKVCMSKYKCTCAYVRGYLCAYVCKCMYVCIYALPLHIVIYWHHFT